MSADDRIEMSEEMAKFWTGVRQELPRPLRKEGFVSAYPLADPDDVDIFTVWRNGMEEHIASLYQVARFSRDRKEDEEPKFNLLVDEPGTDGRTLASVDAKQAAKIITERAADQVRAHLPGAWSTGRDFVQDGTIITMFEDAGSEVKNMGEYTEYVQERADRFLVRRAFTTLIDLLLLEEVPFTTESFPPTRDVQHQPAGADHQDSHRTGEGRGRPVHPGGGGPGECRHHHGPAGRVVPVLHHAAVHPRRHQRRAQ